MADENPPVGGSFNRVQKALNALEADLSRIRKLATEAETAEASRPGSTRAGAAAEARGRTAQARTSSTTEARAETQALRDNVKLSDQAASAAEREAAARRSAAQGLTPAQRAMQALERDSRRAQTAAQRAVDIASGGGDARAKLTAARAAQAARGATPAPGPALSAAERVQQALNAQQVAASRQSPTQEFYQQEAQRLRQQVAPIVAPGSESGAAAVLERQKNLLQEVAQAQANASQQMRRHGALTTEFLTAAARGDATLAEFRYQIGATIAKFSGWTAASAAVFGVLGAIRELGSGAIDSVNAVNLLTRVITHVDRNQASKGISNAAKEFNLPISDVGQVAFQFAQVPQNNTVTKTLEGMRAALYAVKVGDIDAADAAKYLISIQQGLGDSSSELTGRFDQINAAQNRFGVNIAQTTAGLAKSIGAFKAAGGDFNTALAIITTASRVSGRSGQQIGTALQRSAGLIRRPINQQQLREFGIDPNQGISDIYNQAIEQSRHLAGRQRLRLATALSTPQLAPYLVGVLNNPDLYQQVRRGTSPGASQGSAARELSRQLKSPEEQLQRILVGLERLGAALARIGAFDAFGLMLKTLNGSIDALNKLLDLVDSLGGGFSHILTYAVELYALFKLLRRFNVGGALVGTRFEGAAPLLQQPTLVRGRRDFVTAERNVQDLNRTELERVTGRRTRLTYSLGAAGENQLAAEQNYTAAQASGNAEAEVAAARKLRASRAVTERIEQEILELQAEEYALREEINVSEKRIAEARQFTVGQLRAISAQTRLPTPGAPNAAEPEPMARRYPELAPSGEQPGLTSSLREVGVTAAGVSIGEDLAKHAEAGGESVIPQIDTDAVGHRLSEVAKTVSEGGVTQATGPLGKVAYELGDKNASVRLLKSAAEKTEAEASRLGGVLKGAAGRLRTAGAGIIGAAKGLYSMIGPLDLLLVGIPLAIAGGEALKHHFEEQTKKLEQTASFTPTNADTARKAIASARGDTGYTPGNAAYFQDSGLGGKSYYDLLNDQQQAEVQAADRAALSNQAQRKLPISSGHPNRLLYSDAIAKQVDEAARERRNGIISLGELDKRLATAADDAKQSINITAADRKKLQAHIQAMRTGLQGSPLARQYGSTLSPEETEKVLTSYTDILGTQAAGPGQRKRATTAAGYGIAKLASQLSGVTGSLTSTDAAALDKYTDQVAQGISDSVNQQVQVGLLFAHGQDQRNAVYDHALASLRTGANGVTRAIHDERAKLAATRTKLANLKDTRDSLTGAGARGGQGDDLGATDALGAAARAALPAINAAIKSEQTKGKGAENQIKVYERQRAKLQKLLRDSARALADQKFQENQDYLDSVAQVQVNATGNQGEQLRIQIKRIGDKITALIRRYGRNSKEAQDAIAQQEQLQAQALQQQVSIIEAQGSLAAAQDYSAVGAANDQIASLRKALAFTKSHKKLNDPLTILGLQQQIAEQVRSRYQASLQDIGTGFDIRAAETRDPVAQARLAVQRDQAQLAHAKGDDRKTYFLQLLQDRNALDDAVLQQVGDEYDLAIAKTQDPDRKLKLAIQKDKALLARANAGNRTQLLEQYYQDRDALDQQKVTEADAEFDLRASRTDDPIAIARIQIRKSLYDLKHAHGKEARRNAQAQLNQDRRNLNQTIIDETTSDLDYQVQIGAMTTDQEIDALKRLLKLKHLGKEQRKKLLQQIGLLEHEADQDVSSYELTVGDIKLPSTYEIKRAAKAGVSVSRGGVTVNNAPTINVDVSRDVDLDKLGQVLDDALGSSINSGLRAQGAI